MSHSSTFLQELKQRGLVYQFTDEVALTERLTQQSIGLYCGFDPTADSLHLGHLVPLLCLKRFQDAGHKPFALVGGATGMIGDPSFKDAERSLNSADIVVAWADKIRKQISPFLQFDCGTNSAEMVNNYDWFGKLSALDFLRDVGKHFSVNAMINKESVRRRIEREESGISYTEFSYSLLQAYDFQYLNKHHGVDLQIGGSDQWGNITAGIDLVRRENRAQAFGFTVPLITKADGTKFGKTESGAVWLSPEKTSPYQFYQFWLNTADADVYRFLQLFTFMPLEEIAALEAFDQSSGKAPTAQRVLGEQVTALVHGAEGLEAAQRITKSLFGNTLADLTPSDFAQLAQDGMPKIAGKATDFDLQQALVNAELFPSRGQARKQIESNGISVNGKVATDSAYLFQDSDRLFGQYTLLRRGKKNYVLIVW